MCIRFVIIVSVSLPLHQFHFVFVRGTTTQESSAVSIRARGMNLDVSSLIGCVGSRQPRVQPPVQDTTVKSDVLELGAKILQNDSALDPINIYLVGFHPMKNDPSQQSR
ncbi:MAG: hypothetical protein K0Q83_1576 [Deltaproteobacteria bacterium]|nr:hypothetical protein [Deltaproteobacteria bacterium]